MVDLLWRVWIFVLCVLAVYRVAHLITIEDGPVFIFKRFRKWIRNKYPDDKDGYPSWQYEGATCFLCQSVWYSAVAAFFMNPTDIFWWGLYWLAISGTASIVYRIVYRGTMFGVPMQ